MSMQTWDATLYETSHAFVWQYGEALLGLLNAQPDEEILDLGCGTGQLTEKIAATGATVMGIDADPAMIAQACQHYHHIPFAVMDARCIVLDRPVDAVFSNAALHWMKPPEAVVQQVYQVLKPGGRFVAEMGGKGCIQALITSLQTVLTELGYAPPDMSHPWYFPSVSDYAAQLENQGFEVRFMTLFDRPTPLEGEAGLANWFRMFTNSLLFHLSADQQAEVMQRVEQRLRPTHYRQGTWIADYRRLRFVAVKQ